MTPEEAAELVWQMPDAASLRLTQVQRDIRSERERIWRSSRRAFELASRRLGKSHEFAADADEVCRTAPRQIVKYAASTEDSVREFILPIFDALFTDCPVAHRPQWKASESAWVYENGSRITLVGCDEKRKADRLRGPACDRAYIDEAAFIPILPYVIEDVMMPQFVTRPNGRIVVGSSAPESPSHPFAAYVKEARASGRLIEKTIWDAMQPNGLLTRETIEEFCREAGGPRSTTWRREYLCEIIIDETRAVVPEVAHASPDLWLLPAVMPTYRDRYVAWDTGHNDLTVGAFGYLDRLHGCACIEAEVVIEHATVKDIAQWGIDMERSLWGEEAPFDRVADAPPMVLQSLAEEGYPCRSPRRDAEDSILRFRDCVRDARVRIGPSCPTIRAHVSDAIWSVSGRDYERVKRVGSVPGHHFDGLEAARYFVDAIQWDRDPTPPPDPRKGGGWGLLEQQSRSREGLGAMTFGPRRRAMEKLKGG